MKTAISVPDELFERASSRAREFGMSRSAFFAQAVRVYLDELDERSLVRQIDEALDAAGQDDSAPAAVAAGHRRLAGEGEW
jgi:antitoxin MazE6